MANREVQVVASSHPGTPHELGLPQDPVLRGLAIRKMNGQNGVVFVPMQVTDVAPVRATRSSARQARLESLRARFLQFMSESSASRQETMQTRSWGD